MTVLEAKRVSVALGGRQILADVGLQAEAGGFVGLIGPNGSGKTTLLRILAGLLRPDTGGVLIDGHSLADLPDVERARAMAYLPQGTEVHWPLIVERLVALGRIPTLDTWRGLSRSDFEVVARALGSVEALHLKDRVVSTLSTGERARVLFARALASNPRILLADEPVASLDLGHQLLVLDEIKNLCAARMTAIVVFHDLSLAARYCSHLVLLDQGRVFSAGAVSDVLTPGHLRETYGVDATLSSGGGTTQVIAHSRLPKGHGEAPRP
jgi:iron complex transport system ATP-binding protein